MFHSLKKIALAATACALSLTVGVFAVDYATEEAESAISRARAQEIALQEVGGGRVIESEFNDRWFRDNDYEFTVVDSSNRYDVTVDAETGKVLNVGQKAIFEDKLSADDRQRATASVTPERAKSIAMEKVPNATVVDMERGMDGDRVVYSIDMLGTNSKIDMKVDGADGRIIAFEENRIDEQDGVLRMESRWFNREVRPAAADLERSAANAADTVDRAVNNAVNNSR